MKVEEILKKLVSFDTIKDYQNKQIMDYIEKYLEKYNFKTKRIEKCLIAYNDEKPNIGFIGHTDTVDYESWDGNPFELKIDGDKLIGLGSCDMNKIALYLTNDEEIGFEGIDTIKDLIVAPNIIIGEPTNNVPIYGTKGVLELVIEFYGIKCHSSTPDKGKNAIYDCVDFINKLKKFNEKVIKNRINNNFEIPYTTMNIGMINGGETVNSVPGKCSITIDFRIANEDDIIIIKDKISKLLKKYNANLIIKNSLYPKINNNDISFLENISSKKETKCYLTEGSFINKNFIILGPGPDTSHQKNEYIYLSSLNKTVKLYKSIIEYYNK